MITNGHQGEEHMRSRATRGNAIIKEHHQQDNTFNVGHVTDARSSAYPVCHEGLVGSEVLARTNKHSG